jgi:two-component system sensor histidine kinase BarA
MEQKQDPSQYHILFADDQDAIVSIVRLWLKDPRIRLTVVSDGNEVVEAYKSGEFDLVLMDVNMPGRDGCSATMAIRQWEFERSSVPVPIIAMTALSTPTELDRIYKSGFSNYLPKPMTRSTLLQAVGQFRSQARRVEPKVTAFETDSPGAVAIHSVA